jgi:hypothetical protein
MQDGRVVSDLLEAGRGQLAAGIAIDAGGIDIEIARDVYIQSFALIGHGSLDHMHGCH